LNSGTDNQDIPTLQRKWPVERRAILNRRGNRLTKGNGYVQVNVIPFNDSVRYHNINIRTTPLLKI
jgi:hypothetical protein